MDDIKVSIIMLTYKHAGFITQAIEGVIAQVTDFQWELIIADDCSPDGTEAICVSYLSRYPNIRYRRNGINLGANRNFLDAYNSSKGEYIAICEGDDYWTDPNKLQLQVDLLSQNPQLSGCFHDVRTVSADDTIIEKSIIPEIYRNRAIIRRLDICSHNMVPTVSAVFRKLPELPIWLAEVKIGDYVLHLLNTGFGNYRLISSVMAAYRVFPNSNYEALGNEIKAAQKVEMLSYVLTDKSFNFSRVEKYLLYSNYKRNRLICRGLPGVISDRVKMNISEIDRQFSGRRFLPERLRLRLHI